MEKKVTSALTKRYVLSDAVKLLTNTFPEYEQALQRLHDHLGAKHKKKTAEREYILDILYRIEVLIDPPTLHQLVCDTHGMVSLASVYNSLLLFQEIGVVRKVMLMGDSLTFYERVLGNPAHPFAVCPHCKTVWSLPPMDFVEQLDNLVPSRFSPLGHTLIIEGICQKCHKKKKLSDEAEEKAYQQALILKEKKKQKAKKRKSKKLT